MITVTNIETIIVDLPTIRPHLLSMAEMRTQTMVVIRLVCSDGIEGLGESTTIGGPSYSGESPEGIKLVIDRYISPLLAGKDATCTGLLMAIVDKYVQGNFIAKSGIETALLDAQAKRLNVSVATLFGGAISPDLPVLWTLASGDTQKDIEEGKEILLSNRHKDFKLKIGRRSPAEDVRHVVAIKKALGEQTKIVVDVNQAWNEETAKYSISILQDEGIDLIEQPIYRENRDGLGRLAAYFEIPIMADEALQTVTDAFQLAKIGGVGVFALKIAKAGGLYNVMKIAGIGEAAGIGLYGGTMLEGSIGTAASAHVFACIRNLSWGTELFGPLLLTDDVVTTKIQYRNGALQIPNGPGLGVELDSDKLNHYKRK